MSFCASCNFKLWPVNSVGTGWIFPKFSYVWCGLSSYLGEGWQNGFNLQVPLCMQACLHLATPDQRSFYLSSLSEMTGNHYSSSFGYLANLQSSWATFASDSRTSLWMVGVHLFSLSSLEQLQLHGWCFWTWSRLVPGGLANSYCLILLTPVRISSGLYLGNTPCQTAPSPLVTLVHTALSTEWPILIFSWVCDNCSFGVWGGDASQA